MGVTRYCVLPASVLFPFQVPQVARHEGFSRQVGFGRPGTDGQPGCRMANRCIMHPLQWVLSIFFADYVILLSGTADESGQLIALNY